MRLGKTVELLDLIGSQLKRRQWELMTHKAPPSLVGKPSLKEDISLENTSSHAISS